MMTSLRNSPASRQARSSLVTVMRPLQGATGYWISLETKLRVKAPIYVVFVLVILVILVLPGGKTSRVKAGLVSLTSAQLIRPLSGNTHL